jgi:hypothetical protein
VTLFLSAEKNNSFGVFFAAENKHYFWRLGIMPPKIILAAKKLSVSCSDSPTEGTKYL